MVLEVICVKYPEAHLELASNLDIYAEKLMKFIHIVITEYTVTDVVRRLFWGDIPWEKDTVSLQRWILCYGEASSKLLVVVASLTELLANDCPPWVENCALTVGRMIGLDKQLGSRLVGIGDTWRQLFSKYILSVSIQEAKYACVTEQIYGGLEVGI